MKRFIGLLLAFTLLILPACGNGNAVEATSAETAQAETSQQLPEQPEGETPEDNTPATITFAYWGDKNELAAKQKLINLYQEANPHVTIEGTYTDGVQYPTKLQTWFSSNTAPDVMGTANDILTPFKPLGVFEDLTPYMERDGLLDSDTWLEVATDVFRYDGKILAAPYVYKIGAVVYNKSLFDAAELPYPTNDWTEAEMLELARQLTTGEGRDKVYGFRLDWWPDNLYRNLYGNPVYLVEEYRMNAAGNAELKEALELFTGMVLEGISPNEAEIKSVGGGFETGKFAMSLTAPWDMENLDKLIGDSFEWDLVMLPNHPEHGRWNANIYADGYTVSASSSNKDAAWDYVKWLTTDQEAQRNSQMIGVPMLQAYATSQAYLDDYFTSNHYDKSVFVGMMNHAVGWESTGVWAKINDEMANQYKSIIAGKTDIDTAIAEMEAKGQAFLDSESVGDAA